MRKIVAVVGAVVLLVSLFGWWLFVTSFQRMDGTEMVPPGETAVALDAGTYRIYVSGQIANSSQCSPEDHFGDVQSMGLELVPADGGRTLKPRETSICDGGQDEDGLHPFSVSEFRVAKVGDYTLRGAAQLSMTAYNKPVTVFLKDTTHRWTGFAGGLGGNLLGLALLIIGLKPRKADRQTAAVSRS